MNTKETLKKLHETFPDFDTDTLIKILECYIESPTTFPNIISTPGNGTFPETHPKPWDNITYYQDSVSTTKLY